MKQSPDVELTISTKTFIRFWLVILGFITLALVCWAARMPLAMLAISFFMALVLNRPVSFIARYLPGKSRTIHRLLDYRYHDRRLTPYCSADLRSSAVLIPR